MKSFKNILGKLSVDNAINVIGHFLTIISLLLVFFTLIEMQTQRNHAYMPQIVAECNDTVEMKWGHKQDIYFQSDSGEIGGKYKDIDIDLDIYNIGVGVAKNLRFEWVNSNIENLGMYVLY